MCQSGQNLVPRSPPDASGEDGSLAQRLMAQDRLGLAAQGRKTANHVEILRYLAAENKFWLLSSVTLVLLVAQPRLELEGLATVVPNFQEELEPP